MATISIFSHLGFGAAAMRDQAYKRLYRQSKSITGRVNYGFKGIGLYDWNLPEILSCHPCKESKQRFYLYA